jgi:UDPglucose 6-dehydrogenase
MKIGIIGSGYVGLVTGACFAHLGNQVLCIDNDLKKIDLLKRGKSPIYEPGLEEMLKENIKKKRLSFGSKIDVAVRTCEILFICVNTPPKENGEADLSFIENVSREIAHNLKDYRLIIEKSTVPVQTGQWIHKTIKSIQKSQKLFDVASNPEFLREGSAIHDFLNPDRVIVGVSSARAEKLLRQLYAPLKATLLVTDINSAEIIKHASNSFLATKIAFINVVSRICDASGADIEMVAKGMGLDPRIGPSFLKAGIGFGGFCFPKDLAAFHRMAEKLGIPFHILKSVLDSNDEQKNYFVRKIEKNLWNINNKRIGVLGLAFKPNTDDMRYAPSIDIIHALQKEGAHIQAYDPEAVEKAKPYFKGVAFVKNPYEAAKKADALAILTEWDEFKEMDLKRIKKMMVEPIIFDGRNLFEPKEVRKLGFQYYPMGRH